MVITIQVHQAFKIKNGDLDKRKRGQVNLFHFIINKSSILISTVDEEGY